MNRTKIQQKIKDPLPLSNAILLIGLQLSNQTKMRYFLGSVTKQKGTSFLYDIYLKIQTCGGGLGSQTKCPPVTMVWSN